MEERRGEKESLKIRGKIIARDSGDVRRKVGRARIKVTFGRKVFG